jgi:hypothetical protein
MTQSNVESFPAKEGETISLNVNTPTEVSIETKGGTKILFLVTPNNSPTIHVGNDISEFTITPNKLIEELEVIK